MEKLLPLVAGLVIAFVPLVTLNAQPAQMHRDYPGVRAEFVPPILAMKSGIQQGVVKLPWRLFAPEGASPGKKLPLIVALHGAGSRGDENVKPMAVFRPLWERGFQEKHAAFVLAPQMMRSWISREGEFTNFKSDQFPVSGEMRTVYDLVEKTIRENPVDPDRVYVIGMSMGGYGVWEAITRKPGLWAAAVPICGGGDPGKAGVFKHIPIWAWHGSNDPTVPPENTRAIIEALKQAGGNPKYSEPKTEHGSWNNAFASAELFDWLFAQKRSAAKK